MGLHKFGTTSNSPPLSANCSVSVTVKRVSSKCQACCWPVVKHGYRVTKVKDGRAALDFLKSVTPDLMLLDIQLPDMDGIQVIATMRELVPFLIQSSLPDDDHRVVTLTECGALGRVSTKNLLTDVQRVLTK